MLIVEPRIWEEHIEFCHGHGTGDQLFTLAQVLEGPWEFAHSLYMCFVGLGKDLRLCPLMCPVEMALTVWDARVVETFIDPYEKKSRPLA